MCGRYTVFTEDEILEMRAIIQEVSRRFGDDAIAKGEIRPTNNAPILTLDGNRLVPQPVSWGFPKWDGSGVVINARSESALQKTMFEKPLLTRRCVIPSTGFYEWANVADPDPQLSFFSDDDRKQSAKTHKVKFLFCRPNETMLYMAGFMNTYKEQDGSMKDAFVILTTGANSYMPIHDRMPVILEAHECEKWISDETFMHKVLTREGSVLEHRIAS